MLSQDKIRIRMQSINRHVAAMLEALAHNADPDTQARIVELIRNDRRLRELGVVEVAVRSEAIYQIAQEERLVEGESAGLRAVC